MQVVIEARRGRLLGDQRAAVLQPAVHQQDVEAALLQIRAEHQAVMAGADDDAVVADRALRACLLSHVIPSRAGMQRPSRIASPGSPPSQARG